MEDKNLYDLWNSPQEEVSEESIEHSLNILNKRINLFEYEKVAKKKRRKSILAYAAAAVLIPVFILFLMKPQTPKAAYVSDRVYSVPAGERQQIVLPDSTVVYLNSKSILIAPNEFVSNERSVFLIGEAYFKVAKNKEKPFRVKTQLMTIEALGTEFSVLAYSQNDNIKTTLVEGSVRVDAINETTLIEPKILKPSQQSYYDASLNEIIIKEIDVSLYTSWINGDLIFENTPLPAVIERLEIQFNKKINYSNRLKNARISAKFIRNESLDEILSLIAEVTYSQIVKAENAYQIK